MRLISFSVSLSLSRSRSLSLSLSLSLSPSLSRSLALSLLAARLQGLVSLLVCVFSAKGKQLSASACASAVFQSENKARSVAVSTQRCFLQRHLFRCLSLSLSLSLALSLSLSLARSLARSLYLCSLRACKAWSASSSACSAPSASNSRRRRARLRLRHQWQIAFGQLFTKHALMPATAVPQQPTRSASRASNSRRPLAPPMVFDMGT